MKSTDAFSSWLDAALEKAGRELQDVANEAGISKSYLSMLRNGKRSNPQADKVRRLARALCASEREGLEAANTASPSLPSSRVSRTEVFHLHVALSETPTDDYLLHVRFPHLDHTEAAGTFRIGESFVFVPPGHAEEFKCRFLENGQQIVITVPVNVLRDQRSNR